MSGNWIETIHESLVNGQRQQMVCQIDEYCTYDFWADYAAYLQDICAPESNLAFKYFVDATVSYFRIKNR